VKVLGIDVDETLMAQWRTWLMPERQPFVIPADVAAVTLGDGWALNKASQGWMSPVQVLPVREVILRSRYRGLRLGRRLVG